MALRPCLKKCWTIPPKANAEFVAPMEDVLNLNARPDDPTRPVVCMDEKPYQLLGTPRTRSLPPQARVATTGWKTATTSGTEPARSSSGPSRWPGRRRVVARPRRTRINWALEVEPLFTLDYPDAQQVVLVMDNLNTHTFGSLYEAFEPAKARELADQAAVAKQGRPRRASTSTRSSSRGRAPCPPTSRLSTPLDRG